jgi:hypothetical protein
LALPAEEGRVTPVWAMDWVRGQNGHGFDLGSNGVEDGLGDRDADDREAVER